MLEKPIECSQCKKTATIIYKEISGQSILCTEMCLDCPVLQEKLHGDLFGTTHPQSDHSVCCSSCGTTLDSIKMGQSVGCGECYAVFADTLIQELLSAQALPNALKKTLTNKRNQPLHIGKSPTKTAGIALSTKLTSLNEALNEALTLENYEQAAWLRDQIKALTDKSDGSD